MNDVRALHEKAMDFAELAFVAKARGEVGNFQNWSRQAFELEAQAAHAIANKYAEEPTRSVLHRSAAALAIDCQEYDEAERLINDGLAGNPPPEIAEELRELYQQVKSHLHSATFGD